MVPIILSLLYVKLCTHFIFIFIFSAHKAKYGISGFGVSVTTMEEVFIKVGEGFDHTLKGKYVKLW